MGARKKCPRDASPPYNKKNQNFLVDCGTIYTIQDYFFYFFPLGRKKSVDRIRILFEV